MSVLDTLKWAVKGIWTWAKNLFVTDSSDTYTNTVTTDEDENKNKQTLNQQIANWNINQTTTTNNTATMSSGFSDLWERMKNLQQQASLDTIPDTTPVETQDKQDYSLWDLLTSKKAWSEFGKDLNERANNVNNSINDWINSLIDSRKARADYNDKEKLYAVGYNQDNGNVLYLDLNEDRGFFDYDWGTRSWTEDMYNQYLSEFMEQANRPWITQAEQTQAWMDFYNKAKSLFRVRADDYYTDWLFWKTSIWRRKDMYSDDELNALASSWKEKWRYTPTFDEFQNYVFMKFDNDKAKNDIYESYWLGQNDISEDETETFDLSESYQSDWMGKNQDIALKNVDSYFEPMRNVNPNAASSALLTYKSEIIQPQLNRVRERVQPVYRFEKEILWRDSSTWSVWDRNVLETAKKFREMEKAYMEWFNEVLRQTLVYWTDKRWEIVNNLDTFENWESLSDVLTNKLKEISWEDWSLEEHQSALDIFSKMANEAAYFYKQDKNKGSIMGSIKNLWWDVEYFFEPLWDWLWEVWQATLWISMDALNMAVTWQDSLTSDYIDQDVTAFRLLETDDWNIKRTIKKYALEWAEYIPEMAGNLIPDIAMVALTWPGGWATALRHIKDLNRTKQVIDAAKGTSLLNWWRAVLRWTDFATVWKNLWLTEAKIHEIASAAKWVKNVNQTVKTAAELIDRAVTQLWIWQIMDAQWSAYDTEPYSDTSFWMSAIWSWVFDVMPELTRLFTWKWWFQLLSGGKWWGIWNLARYIDSSDEAAENIARALQKGKWEINLDDLKAYAKNFWAVEEAAKQAYKQLSPAEKQAIGKMTKDLAWNYVTQAYGSNSYIGKNVRRILANWSTNIADVVKYLWRIPWDVSMGPYVSSIKLKNWVNANIYTKWNAGYNAVLDSIFYWWFDSRVKNWFSEEDLDRLSKVDWYSSVNKNRDKWFDEIDWTYYLNENWLKHFWLKAENITLESLWVTIKEAKETRQALNKIKWVEWVNLSDKVIDDIADTWWYNEIVEKVKEVLWC